MPRRNHTSLNATEIDDLIDVPEAMIMFSTADWNAPYWTNKQHIALRLAARGCKLLYVESPGIRRPGASARDLKRIAVRLWRAWRSPFQVESNLEVLSPLAIPMGHRLGIIRWLNGAIQSWQLKIWLRRNGAKKPVIWTYHPYYSEAARGIERSQLVYHCVDDLADVPGVDRSYFSHAERDLLMAADHVFTTSPALNKHCAQIAGERCSYERNVADIHHFAQARKLAIAPDLAAIPGPRLVYTGVLAAHKLDFPLIEQCASRQPDWHWVLIGDEPEGQTNAVVQRLRKLPNLHFIGYRPYADLPSYLAGADVAVLPNLTQGYMRGVFPMKFYEYLAAGIPVMSTHIDALSGVSGPVRFADGAETWVEAISNILLHPSPPLSLEDHNLTAFSWSARLNRMLKTIGYGANLTK